MRPLVLAVLPLVIACSSSSSSSGGAPSGGADAGMCPSAAGTWKITAHCDASLVGMNAVVMQNGCSLSFAPPFDGFMGTVTNDGNVSLSGPQTCSGTVAASSISLMCTPGTCMVTLSR